ELDLSLDRFLRGDNYVGHVEQPDQPRGGPAPVLAKSERKVINLASGVRWEQMCDPDSGVDFLHTVYDVGGASTPDESLMRHHGYEYGYVISGTLGVQLEFDEHILGPGDAISFDSNQPHRLYNLGDE